MANANFEIDTGANIGGVYIDATSGNISTPGNITISGSGTLTMSSVQTSLQANSIVQKSYVDNIAVVFGI